MEAIILAGGFGSRLQGVVKDVPKPMADINNKPFLEYIFEYLERSGITRIILSVGYKKDVIEEYFGELFRNIEIIYSKEEEPLGTGGAIKKALTYCKDENIIVLNGDTYFEINLEKLILKHNNNNADLTIALKKMYDFDRYGKVLFKDNRIIGFQEKEFSTNGYINGGVYFIKKSLLNQYNDKFSFEQDFLEKNCNNFYMSTFIDSGYFIDIGVPSDYQKAIYDFGEKKALILDRDGVVNFDTGHVHKIEDFKFVDKIFELCRYYQESGYIIFIVTNQAGIAKGYYSEKDFITLNDWMLREFEKQEIYIKDVLFCPHHPTEGIERYKKICLCRKPSPQMILDIQNKYQISLKKSVLVGDKLSDIEAGYRAGVGELVLLKSKYQDEYDFFDLKHYLKTKEKD